MTTNKQTKKQLNSCPYSRNSDYPSADLILVKGARDLTPTTPSAKDFFWGSLVLGVADGRAMAPVLHPGTAAHHRGLVPTKLLLRALRHKRPKPYAAARCAVIISPSWTRGFLCPYSRNCECPLGGAGVLPWSRKQDRHTSSEWTFLRSFYYVSLG